LVEKASFSVVVRGAAILNGMSFSGQQHLQQRIGAWDKA